MKNKRILAIDLGLKRIGLAIHLEGIISPLKAIFRKNRKQASSELKIIIEENNIDILLFGIPLGGDSEKIMKMRLEHFISLLDFKKEIFYQDETDSSKEAKELIKGLIREKRDGRIDSLAAKIILERWLASRGNFL